ncbi:hypothetical protein NQ315_000419 [Exocentrus adspersus]|uniref:Uncharacterized protein n=1 Tax=Exocentrus adspersus TaxID=1586481 RepID=A0AAV8VLI2_9CUCU|nr:hypothetical protein NQ315_000419 [Exocentrus adspersus]
MFSDTTDNVTQVIVVKYFMSGPHFNSFSLLADVSHLLSILTIFTTLIRTKSCGGFSAKTQLLFFITYSSKYTNVGVYISTYETTLNIFYISSHFVVILLMLVIFRKSYRCQEDDYMTEFLLIISMACSFWLCKIQFIRLEPDDSEAWITEGLWVFSITLELAAIVPQLQMLMRKREVERNVFQYVLLVVIYTTFLHFGWVYHYFVNKRLDAVSAAGYCFSMSIIAFVLLVSVKVKDITLWVKVLINNKPQYLVKNIFFISGDTPRNEVLKENKINSGLILPETV